MFEAKKVTVQTGGEVELLMKELLMKEDKASEDSEVTAEIKHLTKFGNLTILFSKQMKTDFNIT